jgi:hypothetical protein
MIGVGRWLPSSTTEKNTLLPSRRRLAVPSGRGQVPLSRLEERLGGPPLHPKSRYTRFSPARLLVGCRGQVFRGAPKALRGGGCPQHPSPS